MDAAFWQKQLDAFLAAPMPSLVFLALGAIAAWWLRGTVMQGELSAARERVTVVEERLRLAAEQVQLAEKVRQQLETDLAKLERHGNETLGLIDIRTTRETADRAVTAFGNLADKMKEVLVGPGNHEMDLIPIMNKRPS